MTKHLSLHTLMPSACACAHVAITCLHGHTNISWIACVPRAAGQHGLELSLWRGPPGVEIVLPVHTIAACCLVYFTDSSILRLEHMRRKVTVKVDYVLPPPESLSTTLGNYVRGSKSWVAWRLSSPVTAREGTRPSLP